MNMKKLIPFLLLLATVARAQETPLYNGRLATPLNGNRFAITNVSDVVTTGGVSLASLVVSVDTGLSARVTATETNLTAHKVDIYAHENIKLPYTAISNAPWLSPDTGSIQIINIPLTPPARPEVEETNIFSNVIEIPDIGSGDLGNETNWSLSRVCTTNDLAILETGATANKGTCRAKYFINNGSILDTCVITGTLENNWAIAGTTPTLKGVVINNLMIQSGTFSNTVYNYAPYTNSVDGIFGGTYSGLVLNFGYFATIDHGYGYGIPVAVNPIIESPTNDPVSITNIIPARADDFLRAGTKPTPLNSFGDTIHILAWGQSNMHGVPTNTLALDSELIGGVSNAWLNNWDESQGSVGELKYDGGELFGPDLSGARYLQKLTGKKVFVTKLGVGGTGLDWWSGNYAAFPAQIDATQDEWAEAGPVDIVWQIQGESDAQSEETSLDYGANLVDLYAALVANGAITTNVPIVIGGFGASWYTNENYPYIANVVAGITNFAASRGNTFWVPGFDVPTQDIDAGAHYTDAGYVQMGERMASASMQAMGALYFDSLAAPQMSAQVIQANRARLTDLTASTITLLLIKTNDTYAAPGEIWSDGGTLKIKSW
jgi:hypothetical protein